MESISSFRGMAGEVIRGFTRPNLFLSLIPMLVIWALFFIYLLFIGQRIPSIINAILVYCIVVMFLGRFSLAACQGDINAGFFSTNLERKAVLNYVGRYLMITLMWGIPLIIITWAVTGNLNAQFNQLIQSRGQLSFGLYNGIGFHSLIMVLIGIIALLMPLFTTIIAAYTNSFHDVLSLAPWSWLFNERRHDIIPFLASVAGAIILFWIIYIVPFILLTIIGFKISNKLGFLIISFIYLLPWLSAPIIIGRLSGAFIAGESEIDIETDPNHIEAHQQAYPLPNVADVIATDMNTSDTTNHQLSNHTHLSSVRIVDIIEKVCHLNDSDLTTASIRMEQDYQQDSQNLSTLLELIFLQKKQGQTIRSIELAGHAITLALQQKINNLAIDIYRHFIKQRQQLALNDSALAELSDALVAQHHYLDAGWCIYRTSRLNPERLLDCQKQLLALADKAHKADKTQDAVALYHFFIKKFADSTLIDYANDQVIKLQKGG